MESITKEVFLAWAEKANWLLIAEAATPQGRQLSFITPAAGALTFVIFDLKSTLFSIAQPIAQPLPQSPQVGIPILKKG